MLPAYYLGYLVTLVTCASWTGVPGRTAWLACLVISGVRAVHIGWRTLVDIDRYWCTPMRIETMWHEFFFFYERCECNSG
jgi:hypothetical protein